jgi:two-component sensor histidine kinase
VKKGLVGGTEPGTSISREYRVVLSDGDVRWISSRGSHVQLADGTERIIGALFDVTDRKQREDEREAALRQQQMLLKELNHRVKNNLQMITSMLRLQASRSKGGEAGDEFLRAIERVQAISDLHAQLSFEGGFGEIDFADYLNKMCEMLRHSVLAESSIELRCQTKRCVVDLDRAVPLGLIVNELVTNAVKYAFPNKVPGIISIHLEPDEKGGVAVQIEDTGVGMKESAKNGGLGMQLVDGLRRQIGATLDRVEGLGTKYEIRVPPALRDA